jgi:capsular exopolysaccharide synthesis family protein
MDDELQTKFEAARRDGVWVAERLTELRGELQRSEVALEAIRQKYGLSQTGGGATVDQQLIASLNNQLVQAQADTSSSRTRYEQATHIVSTGGKLDGLPEVQASPVIIALRAQDADVGRRIADLTARYTSKYPDVARAQDDRRTIQAQIAAEIGRIADNLHNQYQAAEQRQRAVEAQLSNVMAGQAGGAGPQGHLELQDAERVVSANQALYDSYLARSRDIQQQQTRQEVEARIIAPAFVPDAPSFPKRILFVAGGLGLGGLIGIALVLFGQLVHRGFINVADLEHFALLPVLGTIPKLSRRELASGGRRMDIVEYANTKQLSLFAESLRILRASLHVSAGMKPQVIQITSAVPGEGKSTMSAALAMSAAAAGIRTVLVDADLRHSSVSRLFGLQEHEGIVDVVHGTKSLETALQPYRNLPLNVMGAGSLDLPRPDVINSERFRETIQSLTKNCELVIVDSPPTLAVADALVISHLADATLLVVEWQATRKDFVKQALKVLRNAQAPLVGISLNKVDFSKLRSYDRGYHGFGTYANKTKKYYLN